MLYPGSPLYKVFVEGSADPNLEGEYVIDVAEYSSFSDGTTQQVEYFQMKHTTIRNDQPFVLSDLKKTIEGFSHRFADHIKADDPSSLQVSFSLVTNRPVSSEVKEGVLAIAKGETVKGNLRTTLENYTTLRGPELAEFCTSLRFADGEGDYDSQMHELHKEVAQLVAGAVDTTQLDTLVALIESKVMPNADGEIGRADVLKKFGVTSERELFPAPAQFEIPEQVIHREQYESLRKEILAATQQVIVHASGGVGKSVLTRHLMDTLPADSCGISYDCFGAGKYRSSSEPRHRHRDALVQIANEMAAKGLCAPLIRTGNVVESDILKTFLDRMKAAVASLRLIKRDSVLLLIIDAADNAEMAAAERGDACFARELLSETLPDGCRLVFLSRTERVELLKPSSKVLRLELYPFSAEETLAHLRNSFESATPDEGLEFHRLTNGNPRVQANSLSAGFGSVAQLMTRLGPSVITVDQQIEALLNMAIANLRDLQPEDYRQQIDSICCGLATLPPSIPLNVLAAIADVNEATVKSFVADLGRPLWLSDNFVRFRDEPTETWFRNTFSATKQQIDSFINHLEPLTGPFVYVALALPELLWRAQKYDELIDLALSDRLLPKGNPLDERRVRVHRHEFAFRAALRLKRYAPAAKLALRAGEEVAGNARQFRLLRKNLDLIPLLQNERIQELAHGQLLQGNWNGSENIYSAALLSSVKDFKGEARSYWRAGNEWLHLHFHERKANPEHWDRDSVTTNDIVVMTSTYANLNGMEKAMHYLLTWTPKRIAYKIIRKLVSRLLDAGADETVNEIVNFNSNNPYLVIGRTKALVDLGRCPSGDSMEPCLRLLAKAGSQIRKLDSITFDDPSKPAIVSFLEACASRNLSGETILQVLGFIVPDRSPEFIGNEYPGNFHGEERDAFLRGVALRCVLTGTPEPSIDDLLPTAFTENPSKHDGSIRRVKEIVGALLPWYMIRARILLNDALGGQGSLTNAQERSKNAIEHGWSRTGIVSQEIARLILDIMRLDHGATPEQIEHLHGLYELQTVKPPIQDRINAVRSSYRLPHLLSVRIRLEKSASDFIRSSVSETDPETLAQWNIMLARAVLTEKADAAAYFNDAIDAVSKFGDEIVQRWEAVVAMGSRSAQGGHADAETAYRFMRCAEVVGQNVAREKYFDRDEAVAVCFRLSPESAFATLSRWRDRGVGHFPSQFRALAFELTRTGNLNASAIWSLSPFWEGERLEDFALVCMEKEKDGDSRKRIFEEAVRDLRLADSKEESFRKLQVFGKQNQIGTKDIDDQLRNFYGSSGNSNQAPNPSSNNPTISDPTDWTQVFNGIDLATGPGICEALTRYDASSPDFRDLASFWKNGLKAVPEQYAAKFLRALTQAELLDFFDIQYALNAFPGSWFEKASVRRDLPEILESVGKRFCRQLAERNWLENQFLNMIPAAACAAADKIRAGIVEGLSSRCEMSDSETFFGYVEIAAPLLSHKEASEVLEYALSRFELHIDLQENADGPWSERLLPPETTISAFAGFLWAALGSPRSETRWRAVHSVRRLAESGCSDELDALIDWLQKDSAEAFGGQSLPFYKLHARLYLLVALARVSADSSDLLKLHHAVFAELTTTPHALIQNLAVTIAINIERDFKGTYTPDVTDELNRIGSSQIGMVEEKTTQREIIEQGETERSPGRKFYHGYDFDAYWFQPLGSVFGLSRKEIEDMATNVVRDEFGIVQDGSYRSDPRSSLWRGEETMHSHGSYPRCDDYAFYLSYHSMFVVAARLLQTRPVVQSSWRTDPWGEWLQGHTLSREDGRWLADRRDPAPFVARANSVPPETGILPDITSVEIQSAFLFHREGEVWLHAAGTWETIVNQVKESVHVSTALVSSSHAESLLLALADIPHSDFVDLSYEAMDTAKELNGFTLRKWTVRGDSNNQLDEYDPFAAQIEFPPYSIAEPVTQKLGLVSDDSENRNWSFSPVTSACVSSEIWRVDIHDRDRDSPSSGVRLSVSISFLKKICIEYQSDVLFQIEMERRIIGGAYRRQKDESGKRASRRQIYLISREGVLRDEREYSQVG
jgi:hypothetical protein